MLASLIDRRKLGSLAKDVWNFWLILEQQANIKYIFN